MIISILALPFLQHQDMKKCEGFSVFIRLTAAAVNKIKENPLYQCPCCRV